MSKIKRSWKYVSLSLVIIVSAFAIGFSMYQNHIVSQNTEEKVAYIDSKTKSFNEAKN